MLVQPLVHPPCVALTGPLVHRSIEDVSAHHEGDVLADEVAKVDQGRSGTWQAGQDEDLGSVVLDVILDVDELLHALEGLVVSLRLSGGSPVDFWIPVDDDQVEEAEEAECDQSRGPVHEEHDEEAKKSSGEAHPAVVVLERGSPSNRFDEGCVERGKVDQAVSAEEKVGDERGNGVQLG